ncbi:MAG: dinitrogenase iron-molybdenum cofactor biosynthesis protein [Paludibacteraceae bacterium]|nr:dinitrogenase iron-molybdenum cofactor biosynthesis protein [Paludibacteraceae bacterium]MBP6284199.1 dinitrogenase iron-molybdenum cofactor biosynthesis protein [Paludibacteraceae bacterium]
MKIAVPVKSNNQIDAHFGHCEGYKIYTTEGKSILKEEALESPKSCGCKSDIASVFQQKGVTIMLAGGIGDGAVDALTTHNVEVIRNCQGDANELVINYLNGNVFDKGENCSSHSHDHSCGNH